MPRFHVPLPLSAEMRLNLPPGAARHVQVLRLQPGHGITLFNGQGGEWSATIVRMGRSSVEVQVDRYDAVERELGRAVHLQVGVMAADRMDWLIEKATELGATTLQPLLTERCSLRLSGERAERKRAHWQAVVSAASEQSGRNRLMDVRKQLSFQEHLIAPLTAGAWRGVLSLAADAVPWSDAASMAGTEVVLLSGPEGGLSPAEESAACAAGYVPVSLGSRVLRAETAPLAALSWLSV